MSRLDLRYRRLFKKTHRFVPKRLLEKIVEKGERRLDTIEKRDGLETRVKAFGELLARAHKTDDPELKNQLEDLWWDDEEARLNYLLPIHRHYADTSGDGKWLPNEVANKIFELASQAEAEMKRANEEKTRSKAVVKS
jgi:hypothetical protein